ncbi:MAG: DUF2935 domain-containing protein [Clostridia bacterium]|nr:DUF2935 domain-containing protein [Clostridia bacterium]
MTPIKKRLLSELQFWLRIMKEHSLFLRLGFPCNEANLIQMAQDFESRFAKLEEKSLCLRPDDDVHKLAQEALSTVLEIVQFKTLILDRLIECNLGGANFPLLVDHIRREAIRFAINIIRLCRGELMTPTEELLHDEVFWLRIMADHSKFIRHLLDPSERKFISQAQIFSDTFDELRCQAEDYESILEITPRPIPSLLRFTEDIVKAGTDLRNFKATATQFLKECKILSIIPPLLADHVRREADRFLQDIERDLRVLKQEVKPSPPPCPKPFYPHAPCISLEPTNLDEEKENITEVKKIEADFSTSLQPLYRPKKNFLVGNSAPVKINFN